MSELVTHGSGEGLDLDALESIASASTPGDWALCLDKVAVGDDAPIVMAHERDVRFLIAARMYWLPLIAAARLAPHHCADPSCQGNLNRRRLEAYPKLRGAIATMLERFGHDHWESIHDAGAIQYARTALAQAPEGE